MNNPPLRTPKSFPGPFGTVVCVWFLAGMSLSMVLSGVYFFVGVPLPPLLFFLSGMSYLTGGLLGGIWSRETLRRRGLSSTDVFVALFVLLLSIGFLFASIVFVVIGFQRL
ncbi:MAG: hypothetical protein NVSMB38_20100 [Ktedonobacteraceae bacterium]